MKTSEKFELIAVALHKAQQEMGGATKDAKNPFFKSNYADYGAVLEACKEALNKNGITILQPHSVENGVSYVETVLLHTSGQYVSSQTAVVCAKQNDPQALGSAITYSRRYGLQSLVALPSVDDDGEAAVSRSAPKAFAPAKVSQPVAVAVNVASNVSASPSVETADKSASVVAAPARSQSSFKAPAQRGKPLQTSTVTNGSKSDSGSEW